MNGDLAAYTGDSCVDDAGHLIGDNCVALANMAASPTVWESMVERFEDSAGPLAAAAAQRAAGGRGGRR